MNTRYTSYVVLAALVSALAFAPWRGAAGPPEPDLQPIPVQGLLAPEGRFIGTLTIQAVTVAEAGQLILTGVVDDARTTDVILLHMAPIALAGVGRQLTLARVPLDIEAVPDEGLLFPALLN